MEKGAKLNSRIQRLFAGAGFLTKPNEIDSSEETISLPGGGLRTVDLGATDDHLGVKIIGWNKARKGLKESFTTHVHDYEKLKSVAGADSVLFVSSEKDVSNEHKKYAMTRGMRVWGMEDIEYYEVSLLR